MVNKDRNLLLVSQNELIRRISNLVNYYTERYSFPNLDPLIRNESEYVISLISGIWLIRFLLNVNDINTKKSVLKCLKILKKKHEEAKQLWEYLFLIMNYLDKEILESMLINEIPNLNLALKTDILGTLLQQSLNFETRKKLAANYTNMISAKILVSLINFSGVRSIIDPFCGSGRLISAYLNTLDNKNKFPSIRIIDIMPSAVLIAYCRLVLLLTEMNQDIQLLNVSIGDTFKIINFDKQTDQDLFPETYDLILMNPPFTRTHRIDLDQRRNLNFLKKTYQHLIRGQPGLHIFAMFLANILLSEKGCLATILPAATILSNYSFGLHNLLLENYELDTIAWSESKKAYSEDSNFKEIFLIANRKFKKRNSSINFMNISELNDGLNWHISSNLQITKKKLAKEWNWTLFLKNPNLLHLREILLESNLIKRGTDIDLDIVRGVEMYGPNFFFIPNKNWMLKEDNINEIIIESLKNQISIPHEFLTRSLRKPSKYSKIISPKVSDFALSIPESSNVSHHWLKEYIAISEIEAIAAKKKFGKKWITHISSQLKTKKPFGHLFLIDKFGLTSTSVIAHFTSEKIACSKNFYVVRNLIEEEAKLLAAWLNSTFFIILYLCSRREIGGSYGRLQIVDYMREPLFFDMSKVSSKAKKQIIVEFEKVKSLNLPSLPKQVETKVKIPLDIAIGKGLNFSTDKVENLLEETSKLLKIIFSRLPN